MLLGNLWIYVNQYLQKLDMVHLLFSDRNFVLKTISVENKKETELTLLTINLMKGSPAGI